MAYEAMNHAGFLDKNMIVILNDNQQALPLSECLCVVLALSALNTRAAQCPANAHLPNSSSTVYAPHAPQLCWTGCGECSETPLHPDHSTVRACRLRLACIAQVSLPTQYNGKSQPPVGGLSNALARLQANRPLRELRELAKGITKQLPEPVQVPSHSVA